MNWNELKKKNWIDWLKIFVAIDIAMVGVGLIMGIHLHAFAYLLGFLTRTLFGVLYVFVAVLIFKRVFPQKLAAEEHKEAERMDNEIVETTSSIKKGIKKAAKQSALFIEKIQDKVDNALDKGEEFVKKRKKELREEVKKLTDE